MQNGYTPGTEPLFLFKKYLKKKKSHRATKRLSLPPVWPGEKGMDGWIQTC